MKKVVLLFIFTGMLIGSPSLEAAVGKWRAIKCSISRFHKKFNCTEEEKAVGKKWLIGASIAVALAALAAVIAGGVKLAEVRAEKKRLEQEVPQSQQKIKGMKKIKNLRDKLERDKPTELEMIEGLLAAHFVLPRTFYPLLNTMKNKNIDFGELISIFQGMAKATGEEKMINPIIKKLEEFETPQQKSLRKLREPTVKARGRELTHVSITDIKVKKELNLSTDKDYFKWYEVIGHQSPPSKEEASGIFRKLGFKYHPDKVRGNDEKKAFYTKVVGTISEAKVLMTK